MKTHSHPLFFGGGRNSTIPTFQHTKPQLSVWLDSFRDKWSNVCFVFNWEDELTLSGHPLLLSGKWFDKKRKTKSWEQTEVAAQLSAPHLSLPHFMIPSALLSRYHLGAVRATSAEQHRILSLTWRGKKRHKDWMSDTFVHFRVTEDRRSIRSVQLYWWNINTVTMPLLKAGASLVCTDLKPWQ